MLQEKPSTKIMKRMLELDEETNHSLDPQVRITKAFTIVGTILGVLDDMWEEIQELRKSVDKISK